MGWRAMRGISGKIQRVGSDRQQTNGQSWRPTRRGSGLFSEYGFFVRFNVQTWFSAPEHDSGLISWVFTQISKLQIAWISSITSTSLRITPFSGIEGGSCMVRADCFRNLASQDDVDCSGTAKIGLSRRLCFAKFCLLIRRDSNIASLLRADIWLCVSRRLSCIAAFFFSAYEYLFGSLESIGRGSSTSLFTRNNDPNGKIHKSAKMRWRSARSQKVEAGNWQTAELIWYWWYWICNKPGVNSACLVRREKL